MSLWKKALFVLFMASLVGNCDSDDEADLADRFSTTGTVHKLTTATSEISITDGAAGAKYLVFPYAVGDTSGDNPVEGGDANTTLTFTVEATAGASLTKAPEAPAKLSQVISGYHFDREIRSLINRFDPENEGHWDAVRKLDSWVVTDGPYSSFGFVERPSLEHSFRAMANRPKKEKLEIRGANLTAATCAAVDEVSGASTDLLDPDTMSVFAGDDYCLYYPTSGVTTVTDLELIKTGIAKSMSLYKTVIYNDSFAKTNGDYKFVPYIVVQNYGTDAWGSNPDVSGFFIESLTTEDNYRPTIIVASDQSKVSAETDALKLQEFFHSTVSHELQHAIMHYYRYVNGLELDATQYDEGVAHYMEDVFGYGEVNFPIYSQNFLSLYFSEIGGPVLPSISGTGSAAERGAGHALFHYLVSQKGGVTFGSDGYVNGGTGLDFIRSYVAGTTRNIKGVTAAYGGDWTTVMGQYLGALAIDGASTLNPEDAYKVQIPETSVTNSIGETGKTFGMRFRNHLTLPDFNDAIANGTKLSGAVTLELQNYQTRPLLLELTAAEATIKVTMAQVYTNAGLTVVRYE